MHCPDIICSCIIIIKDKYIVFIFRVAFKFILRGSGPVHDTWNGQLKECGSCNHFVSCVLAYVFISYHIYISLSWL